MKVKDLISILKRVNPEASIIIHRDAQNYGFGLIDNVKFGLYLETDYGGDFYPDQRLVISPDEVEAICLFPEEYDAPQTKKILV